jgi:hypothetical protein
MPLRGILPRGGDTLLPWNTSRPGQALEALKLGMNVVGIAFVPFFSSCKK